MIPEASFLHREETDLRTNNHNNVGAELKVSTREATRQPQLVLFGSIREK